MLVLNIFYFGWEFNRQIKSDVKNSTSVLKIPVGSKQLGLLSEHDDPSALLKKKREIEYEDATTSTQEVDAAANDFAKDADKISPPIELVSELPEINLPAIQVRNGEMSCFTFGPVAEEIYAVGLSDWFKSRLAWVNVRQTSEEGKQLFWVYLAPQASKQDVMETIRDFKKKGIKDYRFINRGNLENAISLGLFSTQAAVNNRLRELAQKGYKPVVVPYYNGKQIFWVNVRFDEDSDIYKQVLSGYPSRYNSIPVNCSEFAIQTTNS